MEKTRFVELLSQWETLRSSDVHELQQLSEKHPWFQALQLIVLKRMHMENHPAFRDTLERTSIGIPDRSILYHLLFQDKGLQKSLVADPPKPEVITESKEEAKEKDHQETASHREDEKEKDHQETASHREDKKEDLIGKFIEAEPRIVPKEGDFAEAVAIAKKSNILYLDVVTETLADVYLQQGNKTKARKIFEKLSLTIPEKSSYFAARIEELRK